MDKLQVEVAASGYQSANSVAEAWKLDPLKKIQQLVPMTLKAGSHWHRPRGNCELEEWQVHMSTCVVK
jgi:hypothetical protein